jgi:hypothetical protein
MIMELADALAFLHSVMGTGGYLIACKQHLSKTRDSGSTIHSDHLDHLEICRNDKCHEKYIYMKHSNIYMSGL